MASYYELKSRIPEIIANLPGEIEGALKATADAIAEGAKSRVPVDSGALRDAIHVEEVEGGYTVVAGSSEAFYGHIVEHGSSRVPPRPFLIPAAESEIPNTIERLKEAMDDA